MVTKTLDAYRDGGLFDQIGFGFFRYSTDRQIRIPHFEKMLYDNALLCLVYAEAFALTGETRFAQTAREVITYLCRDMRSADGGFYTAEDADSEDEEGKFYIFEKDEMEAILAEDAEAFLQIFPVSAGGNFDEKNHLYVSDRQLMDSDETLVSRCREKLMNVRNTRIRPLRDEKIIAGQNGMALAALAVSGRILNDPAIIKLARETEAFIRERLTDPSGHLTSCIIDGKKGQPGFSDDYTFCVYGLLELYFSTGEDIYLQRASQLNAVLLEDFYCPGGGFYQSGTQGETLIANFREIYDGAVPSANAVAVHNLLRLSRLSHDDVLFDIANESLTAFMGTIADSPVSHCFSCINLLLVFGGVADIVLIGKSLDDINKLRKAIPYHSAASIRTIVEEDRHYPLQDGCATAYVCANNRCYPPVSDAAELIKLLSASDASIYTAEQTP